MQLLLTLLMMDLDTVLGAAKVLEGPHRHGKYFTCLKTSVLVMIK
jgi:hypothetical protein